jgi:integrase
MNSLLETHLLPAFGNRAVNSLRREDILAFRLTLSEKKDSKGNPRLSPKSINTVLRVLKSILTEASLRYGFPHPMAGIKRLKVPRRDIVPFSMDEVQQMLSTARADYRNFLIVGFFTGMRPAEQIGLRWENIDFEKREIRVRETLSKGRVEYTKTDGSQREIAMSEPVFQALQDQHAATSQRSDYVFCLKGGQPVDAKNFSDRVWHPLIRYLGLKRRTPYQMRHTCATMWLAAGENPEWIARQLGHTTTEMLFRVYSRFIPNLTRKDGSAFDRLVSDAMKKTPSDAAHPKTASSKTEHSGQGDTK